MGRAVSYKPVLIGWSVPGDVSVGIKCDARVLSDEEEYVPPAAGRYTIKVLFASQVCGQGFFLASCVCISFYFF